MRNTGTTDGAGRAKPDSGCSVNGCPDRARSKGMCIKHARRFERTGGTELLPRADKPACYVDGCLKQSVYTGLCRAHHHKKLRYGDPGDAMGQGVGRYPRVLLHRLVMSQSLGRSLLATETVHHLDGDKLNNTLGNLELRAGAHGKHQRVEDVTAAAVEHLRRYAPQALA